MGAVLSHISNWSHQRRHPGYHEYVFQQHCLVVLEKDLQIAQLQSSINNFRFKEAIGEQLLALKTTIDRTTKEHEEIRHKLGKAEEAIIALSTPNLPSSGLHSISTSFTNSSDAPSQQGSVPEDLINLLDISHEPSSTISTDEETTLHDELFGEESDVERASKNVETDQSLRQSSDWEYKEPSYIVHFANGDEDAKPRDTVALSTEAVRTYYGSTDSLRPLQQRENVSWPSDRSNDSSPDNSSFPSGLFSTESSFTSTSCGATTLGVVDSELDGDCSQLKVLDSEDLNWHESRATVRTAADKFSSSSTRKQANQAVPTSQVPTAPQDAQVSIGANTIEPRWSPADSSQDRENTAWIKRFSAQDGDRDMSYPGFFKYGIHYVPKVNEVDLYRTIIISGLPLSVTMEAVLDKVRGGIVIDAKLLDTIKITGSNTALVTFLYGRSALAYEDHVKQHPIAFGNAFAQVAVVPTPTWPLPVSLRSAIEELGHTRCFEVRNFPRSIFLSAVRQELRSSPVMKSDSLESMKLVGDGVLEMRFSSIRAAAYSSVLFRKTLRYRGCTVKTIPDPCAQSLETLLEPTATCNAFEKDSAEAFYTADAGTRTNEDFGRLTKVDWNFESVHRRGRGFADQASSTTNERILPQETVASITSFAKTFFRSE